MAALYVFEGSIEELIARREEFAGMHLKVEATPEEAIPHAILPNTIRSKEHLLELLAEAENSPFEPLEANYKEMIMQEVRNRLAAGDAAK